MKILALGDTHGDLGHVEFACRRARDEEIDLIVQVGDFGFLWRRSEDLPRLDALLARYDKRLWWLDGNHENFDLMGARGCDPSESDVAVDLTDRIRYLPRGHRFTLGGLKCMSFGGAVSVDKSGPHRRRGVSWWFQEEITPRQSEAVSSESVDVLFSHDAPDGVEALDAYLRTTAHRWPEPALRDADWCRTLLGEVVDQVQPKRIIHGHYHIRYTDQRGATKVDGLDCNDDPKASVLVLDCGEADG